MIFHPRKELLLADTFSRTYSNHKYYCDIDQKIPDLVCLVELELNATPNNIKKIKEQTRNNVELQNLKKKCFHIKVTYSFQMT